MNRGVGFLYDSLQERTAEVRQLRFETFCQTRKIVALTKRVGVSDQLVHAIADSDYVRVHK